MTKTAPTYYTLQQAARMTGLSRQTIHGRIVSGEIRGVARYQWQYLLTPDQVAAIKRRRAPKVSRKTEPANAKPAIFQQ
jgi:predicted site-specific integrase-resolvase